VKDDDPTGEGPLVDEVLGALEQALGGIDVEGLKDAVKKGLHEAVVALDAEGVEADGAPPADDNVVPFDGGREPTEAESDVERVSVQVLSGGLGQGRLRLDEGWQTVWSGPEPRDYRLSLSRGQLEVVVDDQTVAQLHPGQTTDVAGRAIRVRGSGRGHYERL